MASPVQALDGWGRRYFSWLSGRGLPGLVVCALLTGCGTAGFSIEKAVPDTSIVTGSVASAPPDDTGRTSDETIIRAAVSAAIVEESVEGIGWANADTGSRGTIRDISESRDGGFLCRSYVATRESFEGIHLYQGEACLGASRAWSARSFQRVQ